MISTGTVLYGFCEGYFGRDSYGDKLIIGLGSWVGVNWVVVSEGGFILLASGFTDAQLAEWAVPA